MGQGHKSGRSDFHYSLCLLILKEINHTANHMNYLLNILFKRTCREKSTKSVRVQHNEPNDHEYTQLTSSKIKKCYQHHARNTFHALHKSVFSVNMTDIWF